MELFDEPFDELVATKPYTNLGRKYCVVLRDYDRQFDPLTQHDWRRRWQQLQNPSCGIRWITCTENLTPDEFSAELEQHPEIVVIALTRRPSSNEQLSDMLRVALDSGVPVAVWRRDTCPEHDASTVEPSCCWTAFPAGVRSVSFHALHPRSARSSTSAPEQSCHARTPLRLTAIVRASCCSGTIRRERHNRLRLFMSHPTSHWRTSHDRQDLQR